jgi:hypothetical protein
MKIAANYSLVIYFLLSASLGGLITSIYLGLNTEYISIRLIDHSECIGAKYSIVSDKMTFTVSGSQINREPSLMAAESDTMVYLTIQPNSSNEVEYSVLAEYQNCPSIESKKRKVKKGYLLYESIVDGHINHAIRSR